MNYVSSGLIEVEGGERERPERSKLAETPVIRAGAADKAQISWFLPPKMKWIKSSAALVFMRAFKTSVRFGSEANELVDYCDTFRFHNQLKGNFVTLQRGFNLFYLNLNTF